MSVSGPLDGHNGIRIRIGAPRTVLRVCTPKRVYSVPGGAQEIANSKNIAAIALAQLKVDSTTSKPTSNYRSARLMADSWDKWTINPPKVLLAEPKNARQSLTRSYRQLLSRIYARLDTALGVAHLRAD